MTVSELMKHLKGLDGDLMVFTDGYEGGLEDVSVSGEVIEVELNANSREYYGPHNEVMGDFIGTIKGTVKGILL